MFVYKQKLLFSVFRHMDDQYMSSITTRYSRIFKSEKIMSSISSKL